MAAKPRSLLPREHGAYAMMAFPLVTALALARPAPAAMLFVAAVGFGFLLHEPALVLIGRRGERMRREDGPRARRRVRLLLAGAALCGAAAVWLMPASARWAVLGLAPFAAVLPVLVHQGREKTLAGELLVAVCFAAAGIPPALASGVPALPVAIAASVWGAVFVAGTVAVRAIILRFKAKTGGWARLAAAGAAGVGGVAVVLALQRGGPWWSALGVLPAVLVVIGVVAGGVTPRKLRAIGWAMVAANLLALGILLTALHLA